MLELSQDQLAFLYNLLDQVNVRGPEAKALVLSILMKVAEANGSRQPPSAPPPSVPPQAS